MYDRFIKSMKIDFGKWHDGIGYDLAALRNLPPDEQKRAENRLVRHHKKDWRDIEALDVIGSDRAIDVIREGLKSSNVEVKIESARKLKARGLLDDAGMETAILEMLWTIRDDFASIKILELVQEYPTPAVKRLLLWNTIYGQDRTRVSIAALVYFLYGVTSRPDRNYHPRCVSFATENVAERKDVFITLCQDIKVDSSSILKGMPEESISQKTKNQLVIITFAMILTIVLIGFLVALLLTGK
jgi:hypothetical protein